MAKASAAGLWSKVVWAASLWACSPSTDFVDTVFPDGGTVLAAKFAELRPGADLDDVLRVDLLSLREGDGWLGGFEAEGLYVSVDGRVEESVRSVSIGMRGADPAQTFDRLVARWGRPEIAKDPEGRAVWTGPGVSRAFGERRGHRPLVMMFDDRNGVPKLIFASCPIESLLHGPDGTDLSWPGTPMLGSIGAGVDTLGLGVERVEERLPAGDEPAPRDPVVVGYRIAVPSHCPISRERWEELFRARWGEPTLLEPVGDQPFALYAEKPGLSVGVFVPEAGTTSLEVVGPYSWEQFFASAHARFETTRWQPRCDELQEPRGSRCLWIIPGGPEAFAEAVSKRTPWVLRTEAILELWLSPTQAARFEAAAARLIGPGRTRHPSDKLVVFHDRSGLWWRSRRFDDGSAVVGIARREPVETLVELDQLNRTLRLSLFEVREAPLPWPSMFESPPAIGCAVSLRGDELDRKILRCTGGAFDHTDTGEVDVELSSLGERTTEVTVRLGFPDHAFQARPGELSERLVARATALYGPPRTTALGSEFGVPGYAATLRIGETSGEISVTWSRTAPPRSGPGE